MAKSLSPLRYPGGKSKIYEKVKLLIEANDLCNKTYVEPFAGGFGIGIRLLQDNIVQSAVLNDVDIHIYHFWYSVLNCTDNLIKKIVDTPITIEERDRQKKIYEDKDAIPVDDGFATLFLNRVNYSGVIKGGPIGGISQNGEYKVDCRFNKSEIIKKIQKIAKLKEQIELYNCDACDLIINRLIGTKENLFFNIDPPYVVKGSQLYTNYFKEADHKYLSEIINRYLHDIPWIMTYDDCSLIREIYSQYHLQEYYLLHNAGGSVLGKELVITNIPQESFVW